MIGLDRMAVGMDVSWSGKSEVRSEDEWFGQECSTGKLVES